MSSKHAVGNEVSYSEQTEQSTEERFEFIDEVAVREANLRPSVEQEIQGKVDTNHPDVDPEALTLEAEERLLAREWEIERTRKRFDTRATSDREARTREAATRGSVERRHGFGKRAASVDPWADPDGVDPREQLSRDDLGLVNREAARLSGLDLGWSRAAISRRLAERVLEGADVNTAVLDVHEEMRTETGQVVPIAAVGEVSRSEVSIRGTVTTLWEPSNPKISQVGLIEDETDRIKFTSWVRSRQPAVREGDAVVVRDVAKSWYQGRVSVALTGRSSISFPEREAWWAE